MTEGMDRPEPALRLRFLIAGMVILVLGTIDAVRSTAKSTRPVIHATGTLAITVRDQEGAALPARITFVGIEGTARPAFTHSDGALDQPGAILAHDRAFLVGPASLSVPPGHYEIWIGHGPEYDVVSRRIEVVAGRSSSLEVTLPHVVVTPGWVSADFHVHAERSWDSHVPLHARVYQFVADAVDVIVATDHNAVTDYAPVIAVRGLGKQLASLRGDEITTHDWGHFGGFPLPPGDAPLAVAHRTPADMFAELRRRTPAAVIDIHHPRLAQGRIGYFHLGALDPATMRAGREGFSFDFDAVEVLNGFQDPDRRSVDAVLADWYALLRHGHRVTATGNSDTHHLTYNLGGYPRNYVQLPDVPLDQLDGRALAHAVKQGRCYFTTGPLVEVSSGSKGLGDTVSTRGGSLALRVVVRAPAWIDVDRVSVIVDGTTVLQRATTGTPPLRFSDTIDVPIAHDGFVIVRVDGDRAMAPAVGDTGVFAVYPLAITNPIWVDADGDGAITPTAK